MTNGEPRYVAWREFVSVLITMVVAGASLFGWVLSLHADGQHRGTPSIHQHQDLKERLDKVEARNAAALLRIEDKLDDLHKDLHGRGTP